MLYEECYKLMTLYCVRIAVVCCLFYVYNDPMLPHRLSSSMPVKSETDTGIIIMTVSQIIGREQGVAPVT